MPIYEYQCQECGQRTEELQRLDDPPLEECRECGGPMRKLVSAPAFQFKGSGWYVTDYAGKGKQGGEAKAGAKESGPDGAGAKSGAASGGDAKPASKSSSGSAKKAAAD